MLRKEIKSKLQLLTPLFWSKFQVFHEKGAGKVLKLDGTLAPPGKALKISGGKSIISTIVQRPFLEIGH